MYQESLRAFLKPVLPYLDDAAVSEIMINGPTEIWIEARGKLTLTDAKFTEEGLLGAARNIAQFVGRMLNDERPRLDARLPDGSRIHIVIPPIARKGTTISIRKFFKDKLTIEKLIEFGSMTPQMAYLIKAMVHSKLNILVAGGTGSGKTTLLNIVSTLIPEDERILTIEDSAELQLQQEHIVPFESRPADKFGKGEVNMGHLLHSALRLRPDRIVVGEVRGGEAFDLMQAMNTGHGGSMATTHANTPTDTLRRIESLCLMSGIDLPMVAVRSQVASAINAIVTCERFHDGSRRTTAVAEVLPLTEKGDYRTQDLFVYVPTHKDEDGKIHGYHAPTGMIPTFLGSMQSHGFPDITEEFFDPATYGMPPPPKFRGQNVETVWAPSLKHREKHQPDPDNIADMIKRASEYAEIFEARRKEKIKDGTIGEGYNFTNGHGAHPPAHGEAKKDAPKHEEKAPEPPKQQAAPEPKPEPAEARPAPQQQRPPRPQLPPPPEEPAGDDDDLNQSTVMLNRPAPSGPPRANTPPRPAAPGRPPESKIMVSEELGGASFDDEVTPPPRAAPPRPAGGGLPPGKRPLPPTRNTAPPPRRPAYEEPAAEEPFDEEIENTGEKTMIRQVPDKYRR